MVNICICMYKVIGYFYNLDINYMNYKLLIYVCIFYFFILKKIGYFELNLKCVCIKYY